MIVFTLFMLVFSAGALPEYSEEFARSIMLPLSSAAYSKEPHICVEKLFKNATVSRQITTTCDTKTKNLCSGYIAILHHNKAIAMSFRGTSTLNQFFEEIKKTVFTKLSTWKFGGRVSTYFYDAFHRIWDSGMADAFNLLKTAYPDYEVWVTGHSLGGSLASLAASFIVGHGYANANTTKLVTFGQPRTGNDIYSNTYGAQIKYAFRVIHWRDIVPHFPNIGYLHHMREVFYKENMKPNEYAVCEYEKDKRCSYGLFFTASYDNHKHYFGKRVSVYGETGCN